MHELALAQEAVRLVVRDAATRGCRQVVKVVLHCGELTAVLPEALRMAFTCASKGTPLEGAMLDITVIPARARCSLCGCEFKPEDGLLICPTCQTPGARLLSGKELQVVSYEGK